jgi:hypothetical protein
MSSPSRKEIGTPDNLELACARSNANGITMRQPRSNMEKPGNFSLPGLAEIKSEMEEMIT